MSEDAERLIRVMEAQAMLANTWPTIGSRWRHHNGIPYTVLHIANMASRDPAAYPAMVIYQGANGLVWARAASDWRRSMTEITE